MTHRSFPKRTPIARKGAKPKKRKSGSERKRLVKALDAISSLYTKMEHKRRVGPYCFLPGCGQPATQTFHIISRAKYSVRWDERNLTASCAGHNLRYEHDVVLVKRVIDWYITTKGQVAWEQLVTDSNEVAKFENYELQEMLEAIRKKMETVCLTQLPSPFPPTSITPNSIETTRDPSC